MSVQSCLLSLYSLEIPHFEMLLQEDNAQELSLEISGDILEQHEGFWDKLRDHDRKLPVLYGLLPDNISRNWPPVDISIGAGLIEHASSLIERCRDYGIEYVTLELGMNSINQDRLYEEILHRTDIIRGLLPAARRAGVTILLPLRFPLPYPGASEWCHALRLIDEVYDEHLKLLLNVFPTEVQPNNFPLDFQREFFFRVAGIRMPFSASSSQAWQALKLEEWSLLFQEAGFKGFVSLVPQLKDEAVLPRQLENFRNARSFFQPED